MYLYQSFDLLALLGLFVQAFVAWVFTAIFAALGRRRPWEGPYRSWFGAFLALSIALTVMSVRFFRTHDATITEPWWNEGTPLVRVLYMAYGGAKGAFGVLLVRGCFEIAGRTVPLRLRRAGLAAVAVLTCAPLVEPDVGDLILLQAPFMVGCAVVAHRASATARFDAGGLGVVRASLLALAASWTMHAGTTALLRAYPALSTVLAFNSIVDLAVQIPLGAGLIIGLLHDAHRRLGHSESERARLSAEAERNVRLRALGTLVSGVAHELNNPLTAIVGAAEELMRAPNAGLAAQIVEEQAERCRGIVRGLSALAGQSPGRREELDATELSRRVVRGLAAAFAERGAAAEIVDSGAVRVRADRTGLEQVVTNLVANAAQASPRGGRVRIAWTTDARGAELLVTDEGPGLPPDVRARLFEPFFSTKEPGLGMGLGLAVARAIVETHGGTIAAEAGPFGRGAAFRVRLPHAAPLDAAPPAPETAPAEGLHVLVVDDEPAVRLVVRLGGERRGWNVAEAGGAEEALAAIEAGARPDVVLCDLRMPGIGGAGLYERLSRRRPEMALRTVFFSGDLASPEVVAFAATSGRPMVQKPFDFRTLAAAIEKIRMRTALDGPPHVSSASSHPLGRSVEAD